MIWNTDHVCILFAEDISCVAIIYIDYSDTKRHTEKNQLQFISTDKLKNIITLISQSQKM
jgi:hypothetical protein